MITHTRPIIGYNIETKEIISFNIMKDAEKLGFLSSKISQVCNKQREIHKNYIWFFKEHFNQEELEKRIKKYNTPYKKEKVILKEKECTHCRIIKDIDDFYNRKHNSFGKDSICKSCAHLKNNNYIKNNKEKVKAKWGEYYKNYNREYYRNNQEYRIGQLLRKRLRDYIKYSDKRALELLGCSIEKFKIHIESQFQSGMSWDNQGKWHFDHIQQLHTFDLTNNIHIKIAFHYTNIRPLWAKENISRPKKEKKIVISDV